MAWLLEDDRKTIVGDFLLRYLTWGTRQAQQQVRARTGVASSKLPKIDCLVVLAAHEVDARSVGPTQPPLDPLDEVYVMMAATELRKVMPPRADLQARVPRLGSR